MKAMPGPHTNGIISSVVGQVIRYMGEVKLQQQTNSSQTKKKTYFQSANHIDNQT